MTEMLSEDDTAQIFLGSGAASKTGVPVPNTRIVQLHPFGDLVRRDCPSPVHGKRGSRPSKAVQPMRETPQ